MRSTGVNQVFHRLAMMASPLVHKSSRNISKYAFTITIKVADARFEVNRPYSLSLRLPEGGLRLVILLLAPERPYKVS